MFDSLLKWKGVKLVFVVGKNNEEVSGFIYDLIGDFCSVKKISSTGSFLKKMPLIFNDVILLNQSDVEPEELERFFSSFKEVIVLINSDDLSKEKEIISKLSKENTILIDFESKGKVPGKRMNRFLSFGIDSEADFYVSDVKSGEKTNFKINYDGSSVPVWLDGKSSTDDVLKTVSGLGVGVLLGINFVSLTQKLKK